MGNQVKVILGEIFEKYNAFVDPEQPINPEIEKLCAIDDTLIKELGFQLFFH